MAALHIDPLVPGNVVMHEHETSDIVGYVAPITDHTLLSNIGTNTHAQIDTALAGLATTYLKLDGSNDPITGQLDVNNILTSTDLQGYGGVPVTLSKGLKSPYTNQVVVDAGGKGDYTTIASAIAAFPSGGVFIKLSAGTYTESSITIPSNTIIEGAGIGVTIWQNTATNTRMMTSSAASNVSLRNMTILFNRSDNSAVNWSALVFSSTTFIQNCDVDSGGYRTHYNANTGGVYLNCLINRGTSYLDGLTGWESGAKFIGCTIAGTMVTPAGGATGNHQVYGGSIAGAIEQRDATQLFGVRMPSTGTITLGTGSGTPETSLRNINNSTIENLEMRTGTGGVITNSFVKTLNLNDTWSGNSARLRLWNTYVSALNGKSQAGEIWPSGAFIASVSNMSSGQLVAQSNYAPQLFRPYHTGAVPVTIRALANQTGNLLEFQNSSNTVQLSIAKDAEITQNIAKTSATASPINATLTFTQNASNQNQYPYQFTETHNIPDFASIANRSHLVSYNLTVDSDNASTAFTSVKAFTATLNYANKGGVTDLLGYDATLNVNDTGSITNLYGMKFVFANAGGRTPTNTYGVYVNSLAIPGTNWYSFYSEGGTGYFRCGSASTKGLVVQAEAAQSASLQEWINSSGTMLARITKDGYIQSSYDGNYAGYRLEINESATSKIWTNDGQFFIQRASGAGFVVRSTSGGNKDWYVTTSDVVQDQIASWIKFSSLTETNDIGLMLRGKYAGTVGESIDSRPLYFPTHYFDTTYRLEGAMLKAYRDSATPGDYYLGISTGITATQTVKHKFFSNGDVLLGTSDSIKTFWGAGKDMSLYYDGTNAIVNPKEVGTGYLNIKGTVLVDDYLYEDGTFAEIYVADGSTAQSIPTGTTYTKCTLFTTNGASSNCTADATNDKITITKAGKYRVSGTFSMKSGTNNVEFKGTVFYDGTEQSNIHWERKIGVAGDVGNASFSGILTAAANKDIDLRIRHDNAGSIDFTLTYANISICYLGE
jgi:hypothetical protein